MAYHVTLLHFRRPPKLEINGDQQIKISFYVKQTDQNDQRKYTTRCPRKFTIIATIKFTGAGTL
ncbi:hypothetical protein RirG_008340 [Rhizophagus irregularis DAOM 197198w]|uniref:Uncharacterized protein n=1 Tax=Rhizophagus irregularis (strain DAOM 197198w) TaxID=1432141 RepID=A0A015LHM5_RHIIW|nr:hypothetical protein RirG_008340 [Rhizophagus irregularis DAOM 197198w]